jgi:glycine/D-amino acid oxidase-like deaminating enzyme
MWGGRADACEPDAARISRLLHADMARIYPQLADLKVETAWSGLMPIARHHMPVIGPLADGLWAAACFGGLGLVATTLAGELIGAAITEGDDRHRHFAPFGLPFAGGPLGRAAFQLIYWRHKLTDRLALARRSAARRTEAS